MAYPLAVVIYPRGRREFHLT